MSNGSSHRPSRPTVVSSGGLFVGLLKLLTGQLRAEDFESEEKKLWQKTLDGPALSPHQMAAYKRQQERLRQQQEEQEAEGEVETLEDITPEEKHSLSPAAVKIQRIVVDFMQGCASSAHAANMKMDIFNKFGSVLFATGACDVIGATEDITELELKQIIRDSMEVVGAKPPQAQKFVDDYDEYFRVPKYMAMIEKGREAMQAQLNGDSSAPGMLIEALKEWNKKDEKASGQSEAETSAIMFTEIMGYTELTQKAGDAEAQDVLRAHNRIVRAAITRFSGKEIKHLGYGIMASFDGVTNSVEAANAIQRGVENFNLARKDDPMGVRIGINAGEPVREENDIFGSAVQMAARICAIAATGEVMVSEVVASICRGKAMKFDNRGTREMKGFPDPVAVFASKWTVEPAAAE